MRMYVLNNLGEPVREPDPLKAAAFFRNFSNLIVAQHAIGEARVSTVFLGFDHSFTETGLPSLWETMVFGGPLDQHQERYTSRDDAVAGHMGVLRTLAEPLGKPFYEVAVPIPPNEVVDPRPDITIYDRLLEEDR